MRNLGTLFWRDLRQVINYFKAIPQNPKRALIFLLYFAYFGWLGWMNLRRIPGEPVVINPVLMTGMLLGYSALIMLSNLPAAYQEMFTFFKPADVGIVFTSPLSPRLVLAGGLIKSTFSNMLLTVFLLIMGARVMLPDGTSLIAVIGVVLLVMLFNFSMQPFNFLVMRLKHRIPKGWIQGIVTGLWLLPLLMLFYLNGFNFTDWLLDSRIYWVPILGWLSGLAAACYGISVPTWPVLALLFGGFIAGIVGGCLYTATDYYEDVTAGVEQFSALRQRAKEGKGKAIKVNQKRLGQLKKRENVGEIALTEQGMSTRKYQNPWHWRALRIAEKRQRFVYLGSAQFGLILTAIAVVVATYWLSWDSASLPYIYNAVVLYLTFLVSVNSGEKLAFLTPKFVMSPGHPWVKLAGIIRLDLIKQVMTMLLANGILLLSKDVSWQLITLCFVGQMIVYLEIMASNLLVTVYLKNSTDVALITPVLKILQMVLLVGPTAAVVGWVAVTTGNLQLIIASAVAVQLVIVALLLGLSAWQASNLEISQ